MASNTGYKMDACKSVCESMIYFHILSTSTMRLKDFLEDGCPYFNVKRFSLLPGVQKLHRICLFLYKMAALTHPPYSTIYTAYSPLHAETGQYQLTISVYMHSGQVGGSCVQIMKITGMASSSELNSKSFKSDLIVNY